ncbi:MAG TPA: hypothetical protein VMX97_10985 [Hyphomicrobiaceae bacterium]|nr:hypothetical protein [Hyphomicrobiaceae bacterium]
MLLGSVLDRLSDESFALETLIGLDDLTLLARVKGLAADQDITIGEAIIQTVRRFTANADADHWVGLMSTINRTEDPGQAALRQMLEAALPCS